MLNKPFRKITMLRIFLSAMSMTMLLQSCMDSPVSPIPTDSRQLVMVLTDSLHASTGTLQRYVRTEHEWQPAGSSIPVVLGRNGLAWGRGLHSLNTADNPIKAEGDGCSPAGVFTFGPTFGYTPPDSLPELRYPYLHNTKLLECIDDVNSRYYNQKVYRNTVDSVDWTSSERMGHYGDWYAWGVIIEHNAHPVEAGAGSCIFLHNMVRPDESTSGCTELTPDAMEDLIFWLDSTAHPVMVQLTREWHSAYKSSWQLPEVLEGP